MFCAVRVAPPALRRGRVRLPAAVPSHTCSMSENLGLYSECSRLLLSSSHLSNEIDECDPFASSSPAPVTSTPGGSPRETGQRRIYYKFSVFFKGKSAQKIITIDYFWGVGASGRSFFIFLRILGNKKSFFGKRDFQVFLRILGK